MSRRYCLRADCGDCFLLLTGLKLQESGPDPRGFFESYHSAVAVANVLKGELGVTFEVALAYKIGKKYTISGLCQEKQELHISVQHALAHHDVFLGLGKLRMIAPDLCATMREQPRVRDFLSQQAQEALCTLAANVDS